MTKPLFAFSAALLALSALAAVPKGWTDDFEAARKTAEKESRPMLVLFTGSDWCPWCVKLEEEVFARPEFSATIPKEMVTVFLDFPRDRSLVTPERLAQNRALASKYGIRGYPTVLLVDAKGAEIGRTGYRPGGPDAYVEHLRRMVKVATKKAEAR